MANSNSYLGLASRAEELNVGENSQAELDVSARAGFATSELVICFPYQISSLLSVLLEVFVTFLCLLCLSNWWSLEKQKTRHCYWHCFFYATKFACDTNLVSPETRFVSHANRQVSYKFLLQKQPSFLLPALYTEDMSN